MKIDAQTKISTILKEKPEAIDVIADINANFKKLQNPILRRSLASRVSVKDAARIGKVHVNDFLKALENIGFSVNYSNENSFSDTLQIMPPDFINREIVTLDVRPIIAEGKDPFGYINKTAKKIERNQILLIINDFEPIPLIDYLLERNFIHWMKQDEQGNYLTYFKLNCKKSNFVQRLFGKDIPCQFHQTNANDERRKRKHQGKRQRKGLGKGQEQKHLNDIQKTDNQVFDKIKKQYEGKMQEIDVRNLEMPQPMQKILESVEKLQDGEALFVHHKRIPQFLLPELEKRNFSYISKEINLDYTYLIVYKK